MRDICTNNLDLVPFVLAVVIFSFLTMIVGLYMNSRYTLEMQKIMSDFE